MLAQVPRQVLHGLVKLKELSDAPIAQIQARVLELARGRVLRILPFPGMHQTRQTPESLFINPEHFTDFARRRTSTISDHVRGHRRAQLAVPLVNILNRALALIAARQIEIDVRPLTPFFGKKAFEQKFHPHWLAPRDPTRATDG